jgi:hypothetical protein
MTKNHSLAASATGLIAFISLAAALTGCAPSAPSTTTVTQVTPPASAPSPTVVAVDDYDYYPGYEVYYSRTRHDYMYRDGNSWVRRSQPQGISAEVLFALPSVRMDFHDSPERHHETVVHNYPRDWKRPDSKHDDRDDKKDDRKRN